MSRLTTSVVAIAFVLLPFAVRPAGAQVMAPLVSAQQLFEANTAWSTFLKDGVCVWYGREPSGSVVWGWEAQQQCTGTIGIYGYDLNADGSIDVATFPVRDPRCGSFIRAWNWYVNGTFSEYVNGDCVLTSSGTYAIVYALYTNAGRVDCASALQSLNARAGQAYKILLDALQRNTSGVSLQLKIAWHNSNQADLTLVACGGRAPGSRF